MCELDKLRSPRNSCDFARSAKDRKDDTEDDKAEKVWAKKHFREALVADWRTALRALGCGAPSRKVLAEYVRRVREVCASRDVLRVCRDEQLKDCLRALGLGVSAANKEARVQRLANAFAAGEQPANPWGGDENADDEVEPEEGV